MYYLYHIPGKKIGVTRNLKNRVELMQGYNPTEYQVLYTTSNIDEISNMELELQKTFGYKVDMNTYKEVVNKKPKTMKLNVTEQTTTFPVPKSKLKGRLMDMLNDEWETSLGTFKLTQEAINWIEHNALTSMFDKERSFIYNKAFYEAFVAEPSENYIEDDKAIFSEPVHHYEFEEAIESFKRAMAKNNTKTVFDKIRNWADERGIYTNGDAKTQTIKLYEEAGELSQSILKDDQEGVIDAIGDIVVVLTNLAKLRGTSIEACIDSAYAEIANRRGRMINGTFVKEQ